MSSLLPAATTVGPVALTVRDLPRSVWFYEGGLGFQVRDKGERTVRLGAGGPDLLELHGRPGATHEGHTTGLFHFAILVPSRRDLARALVHLGEMGIPLQGAADHLVSEALYLADPEGNGIEIYRDRPREEWIFDDGALRMTTEPLDLPGVLAEAGKGAPWSGMPAGTRIGHVHLRVAEIAAAENFYQSVLGLDLTTRYGGSASFFAAGDYHHHVAVNTWTSLNAPPAPAGAAGLDHFLVRLGDASALEQVAARMRRAGVRIEEVAGGLLVRDPSGNGVLLSAEG